MRIFIAMATTRKRFVQTLAFNAAQLTAMRAFGASVQWVAEFWFYNLYETSPKFSYDPTGSAVDGRYAVRFEGNFQQSLNLGRHTVPVTLIEVS